MLTDQQKANALGSYFTSCFNVSSPPINNITPDVKHECSSNILCTEEEICVILQSLDISKAYGLDGISSLMLKSTVHTIAPSVTKLLNHSIAWQTPFKLEEVLFQKDHGPATHLTSIQSLCFPS